MAKILLLEDMAPFRRMLTSVLREAGHSVTQSGDGAIIYDDEVLGDIEVLISDIDMPKVNGIEAIQIARASNPHLKIIAMSGGGMRDDDDYLGACIALGATDVMQKPFEPDAMVQKLQTLMAG